MCDFTEGATGSPIPVLSVLTKRKNMKEFTIEKAIATLAFELSENKEFRNDLVLELKERILSEYTPYKSVYNQVHNGIELFVTDLIKECVDREII